MLGGSDVTVRPHNSDHLVFSLPSSKALLPEIECYIAHG